MYWIIWLLPKSSLYFGFVCSFILDICYCIWKCVIFSLIMTCCRNALWVFKFFSIICLVKDALPTYYHHFIGFWKFTTKLRKLRREPVHVVFLCDNYFIFVQKYVAFYKITRETGSARGKPVQHGWPVRAVLVHGELLQISSQFSPTY